MNDEQLHTFGALAVKQAADAVTVYPLQGRLYVSRSGWGLLSVPNALVRGAFDALSEPGAELPPNQEGQLNAHISVFRGEEIEAIGGADRLSERGHTFRYGLGPVKTVQPMGWSDMSRVWFIEVKSRELENLRKSYGLSPLPMKGDKQLPFHITLAVRRKNVLRNNDVAKAASYEWEPSEAEQADLAAGHGRVLGSCGCVVSQCRCKHNLPDTYSDEPCDACRDKVAAFEMGDFTEPYGPQGQSYFARGLRGVSPQWQAGRGLLGNVADHVQKAQTVGQTLADNDVSVHNYESQIDPQLGMERFTQQLQGDRSAPRTGWLDQLLLNAPIGKLAAALKAVSGETYRYNDAGLQQITAARRKKKPEVARGLVPPKTPST